MTRLSPPAPSAGTAQQRQNDADELEPVYVARQPVYGREGEVWGFELLFRHSAEATAARIGDPDAATAKVVSDGYMLAQPSLSGGRKALVNFPHNLLVGDAAFALPPDAVTIEILETVPPEPAVLDALKRLKIAGYNLALDDFVGAPGYEPILALLGPGDMVKVDVLGMEVARLKQIAWTLKLGSPGRMLLAEKVEDQAMRDACRAVGFDLFQGYFFSRPEIISGRKLPSARLAKIRLLGEITRPDFDDRKIIQALSTDVGMSYRLLTYANSPALAMHKKVDSIEQAVFRIGRRPLAKWLTAILLTDLTPTPAAEEIAMRSSARGRFLELAALEIRQTPMPPDAMFLLGLFSRIDAILGMPMTEVLELLPLEPALAGALQGKSGPAKDWLDLEAAFDEADWTQVAARVATLGVSPETVSRLRAQALRWAFESVSAPPPKAAPKPANPRR